MLGDRFSGALAGDTWEERPKTETFIPYSHRCRFLLAFQVTEPCFGSQSRCPPLPRRATSPWYHCRSCL